jgi:hypothetical protein
MKLRATIEVEFEAAEGQSEAVLKVALRRGVGELAKGIEYGMMVAPTGIKKGSVRTNVSDPEIIP